MTVLRCPDCRVHIEWMMTRYGRKLPFNHHPVPALETDGQGWLPGQWTVRGRTVTALAPIRHYRREKRQAAQWMVLVHACPEYLDRIAEVLATSIPEEPG